MPRILQGEPVENQRVRAALSNDKLTGTFVCKQSFETGLLDRYVLAAIHNVLNFCATYRFQPFKRSGIKKKRF